MSSPVDDPRTPVTRTGRVVRSPYAMGSRSAHEAVTLQSPDFTYKLMRMGGNPFSDPELDLLVGKRLAATGYLLGANLLLVDWSELADDDADEDELPGASPASNDPPTAEPDDDPTFR